MEWEKEVILEAIEVLQENVDTLQTETRKLYQMSEGLSKRVSKLELYIEVQKINDKINSRD